MSDAFHAFNIDQPHQHFRINKLMQQLVDKRVRVRGVCGHTKSRKLILIRHQIVVILINLIVVILINLIVIILIHFNRLGNLTLIAG